jgi:hypothetical protein
MLDLAVAAKARFGPLAQLLGEQEDGIANGGEIVLSYGGIWVMTV